jgi:hypothetical protein
MQLEKCWSKKWADTAQDCEVLSTNTDSVRYPSKVSGQERPHLNVQSSGHVTLFFVLD